MAEKIKLDSVLLVDDNVAANFVHQKLIRMQNRVEHIYTCTSAEQALNFMRAKHQANHNRPIVPNIIFLDINMPGMNGWEFLEEYRKMEADHVPRPIIFMLTTSSNPEDMTKAAAEDLVSGFLNKPLSYDKVKDILNSHFGLEEPPAN